MSLFFYDIKQLRRVNNKQYTVGPKQESLGTRQSRLKQLENVPVMISTDFY